MNKNTQKANNTSIPANMDEVVTRRVLHEELLKFEERFDQKIRNLGALIEDQNHKLQMIAESLMTHTEASERRWNEHYNMYGFLEKRVSKIESKVALI